MLEMGEEVRRRQNRILSPSHQQFQTPPSTNNYYQHHNQSHGSYANTGSNYTQTHNQILQNTQSLQNLNLNQNQQHYQQHSVTSPNYYYSHQSNTPTSPNYPKSPPVAPKPTKKLEEPPELPPTSTHPLYSQDPPKLPYLLNNNKVAKDPWAREEQERQAEARREQARLWQEQQIRELMTIPNRTPQQEEQLRVLQLEREFQRRAQEAELDDEDTEKVCLENIC